MSGYYGPPIVLPRCKHGAQAYEVCYDCRDERERERRAEEARSTEAFRPYHDMIANHRRWFDDCAFRDVAPVDHCAPQRVRVAPAAAVGVHAAERDDLILQLALQAMHDEDALPVMLDAIEETGWDATPAKWLWEDNRALIWVELTVSSWPRAVAAVLLFAGWPTSWPLAERCCQGDRRMVDEALG